MVEAPFYGRIPNWTQLNAQQLWSAWRRGFRSEDQAIGFAVWSGNRLIKQASRRSQIKFYSIKDEFIRRHSESAQPIREESKPCFRCGGTGWYDEHNEECGRCKGTGQYLCRTLYLYEFVVEGQRYSFHSYATPKIVLTEHAPDLPSYGQMFAQNELDLLPLPMSGILRLLTYVAAAIWKMQLNGDSYV